MPDLIQTDETIVAIATPLGEGGLGVVRISGLKAFPIGSRLFKFPSGELSNSPTHTLHHGWIESDGQKIDEVVAAIFRKPHSYTGDDVVEFSCHGSPTVLKELVELCQREGARLARPGEFTERAFLNGKMDLVQAEAVADLISARSGLARKAATFQLKGGLSDRIQKIRHDLLDAMGQLEANLDFVEEDVPLITPQSLKKLLAAIRSDIKSLLETSLKGRWVREGLRVAIVGKPNVGKSSLFNALLAQDRAIVTEIPGTTRDTLQEQVSWNNVAVVLTDTAGLRETSDVVEKLGRERSLAALDEADAVLAVLDGSAPMTPEDLTVLRSIRGRKCVVVINKSDQPLMMTSADMGTHGNFDSILRTSARTGEGLPELKSAILNVFHENWEDVECTPVISNLRHIHQLESANQQLEAAIQAIENNQADETIGLELRAALRELNVITGEDITDDLLSAIFSRFCIGK